MIKVLLATVAVIAAFAIGMAGMYFAVPALAPQKIEQAQAHRDSLALVDSLGRLYNSELSADSIAALVVSLKHATVSPDSLAAGPVMPDSLAGDTSMTEGARRTGFEAMTGRGESALHDSLARFQQRFEALQREKEGLHEQIETMRKQLGAQQERGVVSQELSETLTKLEDKELAGVVGQLDMDVLTALYEQASARNRTRLLKAMAPPVAAGFVRRLVQPNMASGANTTMPPDTTPPDTTPPDTTVAASDVGNQPETMNQ